MVSSGGRSLYLIEPKILHWEDRATECSGKADRVKISLPLYRSGSLVGSALVTADSSWWTFGGNHPEDRLDAPFESYAVIAGRQSQFKLGSFRGRAPIYRQPVFSVPLLPEIAPSTGTDPWGV